MSWGAEFRGQRAKGLHKGLGVLSTQCHHSLRFWRLTPVPKQGKSRCKALGEDGSFSLMGRLWNPQPTQERDWQQNTEQQSHRARPAEVQSPTHSLLLPRTWVPSLFTTSCPPAEKGASSPIHAVEHHMALKNDRALIAYQTEGPQRTLCPQQGQTQRTTQFGLHDRKCPELGSRFMDSWVPGAGRLRWEVSK